MGQRPHVPHELLLAAERLPEPVARIVATVLHGDGPLHHGADALADTPRRLRLPVPDGPERLEHVGAGEVAHRHPADVREHVSGQARLPLMAVPRAAPAGLHLGPDPFDGVGEGGHALGPALGFDRADATDKSLGMRDYPGQSGTIRDKTPVFAVVFGRRRGQMGIKTFVPRFSPIRRGGWGRF